MHEAKVTAKKSVAKFGTTDVAAVTIKYSNLSLERMTGITFLQFSKKNNTANLYD